MLHDCICGFMVFSAEVSDAVYNVKGESSRCCRMFRQVFQTVISVISKELEIFQASRKNNCEDSLPHNRLVKRVFEVVLVQVIPERILTLSFSRRQPAVCTALNGGIDEVIPTYPLKWIGRHIIVWSKQLYRLLYVVVQ